VIIYKLTVIVLLLVILQNNKKIDLEYLNKQHYLFKPDSHLNYMSVPHREHSVSSSERAIFKDTLANDVIYCVNHMKHTNIGVGKKKKESFLRHSFARLLWSRGSVLAFGTQVRGFKPDRSRRIFQGEKKPQHAFLQKGSIAVCPMS
jgi:hypothetical protein